MPDIGEKAPSLVVSLLDGRTVDLASLQGKVVLIHFWASWCVPCREEIPALESYYRYAHLKGLEIISLSVDRERVRSTVEKIAALISYPVAMVAEAENDGFEMPDALPFTWLVDSK